MSHITEIEVKHLNVFRNQRHILKNISCKTMRGEVYGLIGANGSGKSTLLKSLLNLLPAKSGSITIQNQPLQQWKPHTLAQTMGYMAQENQCQWSLTVKHLVMLGRMPYQTAWKSYNNRDLEITHDAMKAVGVEHLAERTVTRLSGGELHRVLLARALAGEPSIILADEPTAGLDPYHQLHLMELFQQQAQEGKTVIVVLHDLTLASRFCNRLLLLKAGTALAEGLPQNVLSEEHLREGYAIEAAHHEHNSVRTIIPWACAR